MLFTSHQARQSSSRIWEVGQVRWRWCPWVASPAYVGNTKDLQKLTNNIVPIFITKPSSISSFRKSFPRRTPKSFLPNWALLDGIWSSARPMSLQVSTEQMTTPIFCPLRSLGATPLINFELTPKCSGIYCNLRMTDMSAPKVQMGNHTQQLIVPLVVLLPNSWPMRRLSWWRTHERNRP